ncbi:MAG: flagellar motor protein [Candidatus Sericytochromatia bacterium]|nr:flagellar motor protein [Candidatus Tanganyikabacteria bacterium]
MEISTPIGLILGWASMLIAFTMEGGTIGALMQATAAMIVFGGTFGAAVTAFPMRDCLNIPNLMAMSFKKNSLEPHTLIPQLVRYAEKARKEGLLALEADVADAGDEFLQKGMQMVSDGIDLNTVREMLETELSFIASRHAASFGIFEAMGGYAPTMGILGTVMGLISVLSNLDDPSTLGPSIALAFVATLYGVWTANLLWLPIASKLKRKSEEEILVRELMLAGVLSIQAGDNPQIVEEKLKSYLSPTLRRQIAKRDD